KNPDEDDSYSQNDESEEYYAKLRKHKRYPAKGSISLVIDGEGLSFPLRDYSAGGLSFLSLQSFKTGDKLTASLKDPIEKEVSVLDFEFEVARVIAFNEQLIVGCKFFDDVDEELWHSLIA
ncbi:MAG: PilZ domain-containing protein, partial [Proteobacteria bacterium]|nr:PilZ domain-containing protein [Pseudomonadota bacterium]